jgi:hydrogenase nickel incorporation protein HypB
MCATCGCDTNSALSIQEPGHTHHHTGNGDGHDHCHPHHKSVVEIEQDVLHQNNLLAQRNRGYFDAKNILALNLETCQLARFGQNHFARKNTG